MGDLTGKRFGRIVVCSSTKERYHGVVVWKCLCDCGETGSYDTRSLNKGTRKSCDSCIEKPRVVQLVPTIYNLGINDVKEDLKIGSPLHEKYLIWRGIIARVSNIKRYENTNICTEWLRFSNFLCWVDKQTFKGKDLDKDLLSDNQKLYSPKTCCFLPPNINSFIVGCGNKTHSEGVSWRKKEQKYCARITDPFVKSKSNPTKNKRVWLGYYEDVPSAHEVWRKHKHKYANLLADSITWDDRARDRLKVMYSSENWYDIGDNNV